LTAPAQEDATVKTSRRWHTRVTRVLLVDDDEVICSALSLALTEYGFQVTSACDVVQALGYITTQQFDVLLSDLHMPGPGDGLTVVSAMRHANPSAVTLLLSAFPRMEAAAQALLLQADEILVKPVNIAALIEVIRHRVAIGPSSSRVIESVATILERTTQDTIRDWYALAKMTNLIMTVAMSQEVRCGHLPQLFLELVARLRSSRTIGGDLSISPAALAHGHDRRRLGYNALMLVEESRLLQVSIFNSLQDNLSNIDYSLLLIGVMTIADEVDGQLCQQIASFTAEPDRRTPAW
jgi:CheY-like chemotaxis protein